MTGDGKQRGEADSRARMPADGAALGRPTRARQWVIVFAVTLAIITYVDRVCISQAESFIRQDLGLTKVQMGYVFSAFLFAYSLFEIPGGWLGDLIGPRKVLMRVVTMWSLFTAATGWAWNMTSLTVCRFFFGVGEAGCFPNLTKAFTVWLPQHERVRAQGIMWLSARWGGAFTPLLVILVLELVHWRWAFVLFGSLGVVWAVFFYRWFRDDPREHPGVNPAELALMEGSHENASGHGNVPWGKFLSSGTVWMLWLQYACMSYGWYFYVTWLPTYLHEVRGLALAESPVAMWLKTALQDVMSAGLVDKVLLGVLAGFPLFFGGLGCFIAGILARHLVAVLGTTARVRRVVAVFGLVLAGIMIVLSSRLQSPTLAMLAMGAASFANDLVMPGAWGACMDVGGKYAGSLSGSMNMMGNFGGMFGPMTVPYILELSGGDWNVAFWVFGAVYWLGAFAWCFIDPVTPLSRDEH